MISCNEVGKTYAGKVAVEDVSCTIEAGKVYVLLGPNGSGKSTLMKMIAGVVVPTNGNILFNGEKIGAESKKHIAYMPTEAYFYDYMTCKDFGKYYEDFFEDFHMDWYESLLERMELPMKQKMAKMSSGMVAKCKVAVTLARDAQVRMFDEPLNGIDIIAREQIIENIGIVKAQNRSMIVSSHLVEEMESLVDACLFMKNGKLVLQGDYQDLKQQYGKNIIDLYKEVYAY